jgi:integrase
MGDIQENAVVAPTYSAAQALGPDVARAADLIAHARAPNTRRAYESSRGIFEGWCLDKRIVSVAATPEIVAAYLSWRLSEGLLPVSLSREYSAIAFFLRSSSREGAITWPRKHRPHVIAELLAGAFQTKGRPPVRKKPLTAEHFVRLAKTSWGDGLEGARNRALLMLGFVGAFRRSELVALDREDLSLDDQEGLRVVVRRGKTDQEGRGMTKAIAWEREAPQLCTIKALGTWIRAARIASGPLFRRLRGSRVVTGDRISAEMVAVLVKRAVLRLGLNPSLYAGHSLRCGFVTSAALQGTPLDEIMAQTGHKSHAQVAEYIRRESPFQNNAATRIFEDARKP